MQGGKGLGLEQENGRGVLETGRKVGAVDCEVGFRGVKEGDFEG